MRLFLVLTVSVFVGLASRVAVSQAGDLTAADFETAEYLANIGLGEINASTAYAKGFTGAGSIIGIIDSGFQSNHPEFDNPIVSGVPPVGSHGTHVAGIAAAIKNDIGMHGVAYDARLFLASNSNPGAEFINAANAGAAVISNSWGYDVDVNNVLNNGSFATDPYQALANVVGGGAAFWQSFVADSLTAQQNSVILFAVANVIFPDIDVSAGLPLVIPELQGSWIAVVNVKQDGTLNSSPCGSAASFCLGAPGTDIYSTVPVNTYGLKTGTSMATPHVAGAVAIAKQIFPNATPKQLTSAVLETATDIGAPGIDTSFGRGFLNLANLANTVNPATANLFPASSWSNLSVLAHVRTTIRQRMNKKNNTETDESVESFQLGKFEDETASYDASRWQRDNLWITAIGAQSNLDAGPISSAYSAVTSGIIVGADGRINQDKNLGFAAGITRSSLSSDSGQNNGVTTAGHVLTYGGWTEDNKFMDASAQLALFSQSLERRDISGAVGTSASVAGLSSMYSVATEVDFRAATN